MDTSGKSDAAVGEPAMRRLRTLEWKLSILTEAGKLAEPGLESRRFEELSMWHY
jgi:hypothetical protein